MLRMIGRTVGALVLTSVIAHAAIAQGNLPRAASIATNPQGSLFYSVGSAFAKVLSGALPTNVNVRPFTGPTLFIPMLHGGELAFALNILSTPTCTTTAPNHGLSLKVSALSHRSSASTAP